MRIGQTQAARPTPLDRNGVERGLRFFATATAPHASTQRFTYTCPAGKKMLVENVQAITLRETVAAPVVQYSASVLLMLLGVTQVELATALSLGNVIGSQDRALQASQASIVPTTLLQGFTADGSTGGTVTYLLDAKGVEYDA